MNRLEAGKRLRVLRLVMPTLFACVVAVPAWTQSLATRIVTAEEARGAGVYAIPPLLEGLRSTDPTLIAKAVRAIGRLERPQLSGELLSMLSHERADIRQEAANALGQSFASVSRAPDAPAPPELAPATQALVARLRLESDPKVIGTIAETLGRLPHKGQAAWREVEQIIRNLLPPAADEPPASSDTARLPVRSDARALAGVVKGLETLIRRTQKVQPPEPLTLSRLRAVARFRDDRAEADSAYVRRVAWLAITAAAAADAETIASGYDDPDAQVRRLAVLALANAPMDGAARRGVLVRALKDPSFNVRYDAVRIYSRTLQAQDCGPIIAAVDDANPHLALAAIDALGEGCPAGPDGGPTLLALSNALARNATWKPADTWHRPARALVSLARTRSADAQTRLPPFTGLSVWQVRAYAARAAIALKDVGTLERLAADPDDNVRYEALLGLRQLRGHDADAVFIDALARPDYQLVMAAAQSLQASTRAADAAPALLRAFTRISAQRRETSRDVRMALLERLRELGSNEQAGSLQSCLTDFDPKVAAECGSLLTFWTKQPQLPMPVPLPLASVPPSLPGRAMVTMDRGGTFVLRLLPDEAPAAVARFVRLARSGYYNGLTFHRVAPNFVIQGGSPGANEYAGDGPFMRDELGLRSHTRGTVGVSTRGRDTGDAQIFVNLLDNARLDHEFTIFAEVAAGMAIVDGILEGDAIRRIEIDSRRQ